MTKFGPKVDETAFGISGVVSSVPVDTVRIPLCERIVYVILSNENLRI